MFAVLLGVMTGLPQIIAIERIGSQFQGIYPTNNDDELYYLARAREVIDGHRLVAQPYLWEGKERLPLQFWVPDNLLAFLSRMMGSTNMDTFIMLDVFLPATLFLLTYAIGFMLSRSVWLALSGAIFLHFYLYFQLFNRPNSPQINFLFFLFFVMSAIRWVRSPSRLTAIILGISFGLLFHVYTYYWTYAVVAFVLAGIGYLFYRDYGHARSILQASGVAAIVAIPYFIQLFHSFNYEFYQETINRVGMIETHMPSGMYIVILASIYATVLLMAKLFGKITWSPETILVSALVFAAPIVTNQHIITGENLEFSSHYRWLASFVTVFGITHLISSVMRTTVISTPWQLGFRMFVGAIIGWSVLSAGTIAFAQSAMRQDEIDAQRYAPVLAWLREHAKADEVVFAREELSRLIPAYTSQNVFYAREANLHYMSNAEVRERFLVRNYFDPPLAREDIFDIERSVWGTYYINRWQHAQQSNKILGVFGLPKKEVARLPDEEVERLLNDDQKLKQKDFRDIIARYRVDYLVWDTPSDPEWAVDSRAPGLVLVALVGEGFRIYRIP
jgi:hypothetical protein